MSGLPPVPVPVPAPTCSSLYVPDSWVSIKSTSSPKVMCPNGNGGFYQANGNDGWGDGGDGCYVHMDEFTTVSPGCRSTRPHICRRTSDLHIRRRTSTLYIWSIHLPRTSVHRCCLPQAGAAVSLSPIIHMSVRPFPGQELRVPCRGSQRPLLHELVGPAPAPPPPLALAHPLPTSTTFCMNW